MKHSSEHHAAGSMLTLDGGRGSRVWDDQRRQGGAKSRHARGRGALAPCGGSRTGSKAARQWVRRRQTGDVCSWAA